MKELNAIDVCMPEKHYMVDVNKKIDVERLSRRNIDLEYF